MGIALIAIGANMGDMLNTFKKVKKKLDQRPDISMHRQSGLYESEFQGLGQEADREETGKDQDNYINAMLSIHTHLDAHTLLEHLLLIETELGRQRPCHCSPRIIDLDLICYEALNHDDAILSLPHPRCHERDFVLQPWMDIHPEIEHPVLKQSPKTLLAHTRSSIIRRIEATW